MWPNKALLNSTFWRTDLLLWVALGFIHVSPALASICLGLFVIQLLFLGDRVAMSFVQRVSLSLMALSLLWNVLSLMDVYGGYITHGLNSHDFMADLSLSDLQKLALTKLQVKLPLFVVLTLYATGKRLSTVLYRFWPLVVLPVFWISVSSVIHYLQHRTFYDQMVLESKPIPLYSGVYHIEYAVLVGCVVLLMAKGLLRGVVEGQASRRLLVVALAVLVICMHVLGARTGLIFLYVGGAVMLFDVARRHRQWLLRGGLVLALLMGVLSMLPSVQNRVTNTLTDLKTTFQGGDVTHQSFGQRWVAWTVACATITESNSAWKGFGAGVDVVMKAQYERKGVALAERHRIGVHNQWLEGALQSGWMSFVLLLVAGFFALGDGRNGDRTMEVALWLAVVVAMMFESLMERQAGILVLIVLFQGAMAKKNGIYSEIKTEDALIDKIK